MSSGDRTSEDGGRAESRWADLDGPVHYTDFGGPDEGPLLVCVHGLGGSHLNWAAVGPRLARTCRVLAVDLAGHGRTESAGRSTSVAANARLLHRFLTEVAGTPAVLVGNSMGGTITILEASEHPEAVAGAVLVDPALPQLRAVRPDPLVALTFAGYAVPGLGELFLAGRRRRSTPEEQVRETLRLCCVAPSRVPREVVELSVELARERREQAGVEAGFLAAARTLLRVLLRPGPYRRRMRDIRVPVLLLHGERDRLVPVGAARVAAGDNPLWRFEVVEDVGHLPQLEAPEWTADTVLDWLAREGRAADRAARAAQRAAAPQ